MGTRYENLQDLFSKAPPIRAGGVGDKWTYNAPETQAGANFYHLFLRFLLIFSTFQVGLPKHCILLVYP